MRHARSLALLLLAALFVVPSLGKTPALELWYGEPAADWEHHGLPIGNGALGAVITGGVAVDRIQFNEKSLWTGGPGSKGYNFGLPAHSLIGLVGEVQKTLNEKKRLEPEQVAEILGQPVVGYGDYQTFGEVVLTFENAPAKMENYRRSLDLKRAVAAVRYEADGVTYTREYFASYPAGVIVMHLTASRPGKLSFTAALTAPDNRSVVRTAQNGRITEYGALNDNALKYEAQLQIVTHGGTRHDEKDGSVSVKDANSAILILGAGTNYLPHYPDYRGPDPREGVQARVDMAMGHGYARLLREHLKDYRALFDRVALDLRQTMPDQPTDALLRDYGKDPAAGRALEALYFQYGRYLLIASSRAGSLPANLQGVWSNSTTPPWNADYHVNINLQMNYWLAETTNLAEAGTPFFDFVDSLVEPGRVSARRIMGAGGWTLSLNTNAWGFTGLIAWPTAFWQPEAGAWLASQVYDHYRFTGDETFLKTRAYPVLKTASEFWLDALVTDPRDGTLVVSPSYSPEHGPFSVGAAMSQQIVAGVFRDAAEAAGLVGDAAFKAKVEAALAKLDPGLRIGSWGQLQEWKEDWDDPKDEHRHVSQLYALHPGHRISPLTTPAFAEAARVTLKGRGDGGTGWSKAWKINFWARLHDGDHAHLMLSQQLKQSTTPNLWDTHPPFQIDGNFGATAGIAEILLQSQGGVIDILPALPRVWSEGSVRGLRARGDVTVGIIWRGGAAQSITLVTGKTGRLTIRSTLFLGRFKLVDEKNGARISATGTGLERSFKAKAGGQYRLFALPIAKKKTGSARPPQ